MNQTTNNAPISKSPQPLTADDFYIHRQMVMGLFLMTVVLCVVFASYMLGDDPSTLFAVLFAGALGGFVSALRRLYAFKNPFPSGNIAYTLRKSKIYIAVYSLIPPLIGAIAAVTLYVFFAAQIVQNSAFPEFHLATNKDIHPFYQFIQDYKPVCPTDYAKALIWGFVAGFSERFVPNILTRLTKAGEQNSTKS